MSAIEQLSPLPSERRRHPRFRLAAALPVHFGRGEGLLVDVSVRGARIRHDQPVALRARVRLTFDWEGERFCAPADVLASRIVALGEGARFETRVEFGSLPVGAERLLAGIIDGLQDRHLREWVANLQGWESDARGEAQAAGCDAFIRYRYRFGKWESKWTRDSHQPADGFTLPAGIHQPEVRQLCDTFAKADEDVRQLVRRMAAAVVTETIERRPAADAKTE